MVPDKIRRVVDEKAGGKLELIYIVKITVTQ
jgi:hypothetical protein